MDQGRIEKLPKWAQDHIRSLEARAKIAERAVEAAENIKTRDETYDNRFPVAAILPPDCALVLPERTRVKLCPPPSKSFWVEVSIDVDAVEVRTNRSMRILPRVSNTINICEGD